MEGVSNPTDTDDELIVKLIWADALLATLKSFYNFILTEKFDSGYTERYRNSLRSADNDDVGNKDL
jgi:hypothetical protein